MISVIYLQTNIHDVCYEGINALPQGISSYPKQFSRFPYYENLQIAHVFDTMHIRKNVTEKLWQLFELRRDKEKNVKFCEEIQEGSHAMNDVIQFHSNREQLNISSIPWMFTEEKSNFVEEVMWKIKFPIRFCANMMNIITKKGDFSGVKMHDWHVFVKVIVIVISI